MPTATLKHPASLTFRGRDRFWKGKKKEVTAEMAAFLSKDKRFTVDWEGVRPVAAPATVPLPPKTEDTTGDVGNGTTVAEALDLVDVDNEANWTGDGKPSTGALSELCGRDVTEEERDQVMARIAKEAAAPPIENAPPAGRTRIIKKPKPDPTTEGAQEV